MSSFKREIRKFHVVVRVKKKIAKEMYQKVWRRCKVIDLLTKSTAFLCSRCILNSLICLFLGVTGQEGERSFVYPDAILITCNIVVCKLVTDFMMIMMVILYFYLFLFGTVP